jgi:hypothetical protein
MVMLEMIIVKLIMCSTICKQQNKQLVNHCHSRFFVIQIFYNYNVVVDSKHKLHDDYVQIMHFDFEGKFLFLVFIIVFYIVAWEQLEIVGVIFCNSIVFFVNAWNIWNRLRSSLLHFVFGVYFNPPYNSAWPLNDHVD